MNRLPVIEHLPPAEIARRYRTCPDGAEKTRWQVLLAGHPARTRRCPPGGPPGPSG